MLEECAAKGERMKLIRCENGHLYDGSIYPVCPHCNDNEKLESYRGRADAQLSDKIREKAETAVTMPLRQPGADAATIPLEQAKTDAVTIPLEQAKTDAVTMPLEQAKTDAVTMPLERAEADAVTMPLIQSEPVTGWLVCVKGKDFGRSFSLKNGSNFIGSSWEMDVVLESGDGIANERHAEVFYDAQRRRFTLKVWAYAEATYLNDAIVRDSKRLRPYDILSVGNVNLMFIPCCGKKFGWEDGKVSVWQNTGFLQRIFRLK